MHSSGKRTMLVARAALVMLSHFVGVDEMDLGRDPAPPRPPYRILDDLDPPSVAGQWHFRANAI
jgi:hypothetical protein